jgi:hypothetical protein
LKNSSQVTFGEGLLLFSFFTYHLFSSPSSRSLSLPFSFSLSFYFRAVDGYEYLSSTLNVLLTDIVAQPTLKLFDPRTMMDVMPYISAEQERVIAEDCKKYLKLLEQELLQSLKYFPYGLRWLASQFIR